ncbi:MAG: hypothetical protein H5U19_09175 [Rhodobacteraceae bacterium]|jgi:hypothetical protein|nr:hypothetical protein [Paracoccaceae bacterium]
MRYSVVMIVSAASRAAGDKLGVALGWGAENFTVPLHADAQPPASHFGLRITAGPELIALLSDARKGVLPDLPGLSQDDLALVLSDLITDVRPDSARGGHFEDVTDRHGLKRIEPALPPDLA